MPDNWEKKYGFDRNDPSDASRDTDGNGYTNIEEFLNGTNPLLEEELQHAANLIKSEQCIGKLGPNKSTPFRWSRAASDWMLAPHRASHAG